MLGDTQHDPSYCVPRVLQQPQRSANVMDVFTIVIGLAGTISALLLRHSAAYRTNTIHRTPILPLSPTHLEFHPLLETAPVRIPWDRGPSL